MDLGAMSGFGVTHSYLHLHTHTHKQYEDSLAFDQQTQRIYEFLFPQKKVPVLPAQARSK